VPVGAYATLDSAANRVSRVSIFKGEAIVPGRLAPEGTAPGLEVKLTPGKRAYAVRINDVAGLAGMVQPNSRVDVMVVLADPNDGAKPMAKLFMENMRVLAIGDPRDDPDAVAPSSGAMATLEVTPDEAERLAIATAQGQIQLVLRGYGDPDSMTTLGTWAPRPTSAMDAGGCGVPNRHGVIVRDLLLRPCPPELKRFSTDSAPRSELRRR
jgi:pilus assembly protein CpaB